VQRIYVRDAMVVLNEFSNRRISPKFVSVVCWKCPHNGDDDLPPWEDPEHLALLKQRHAELREEEAQRLARATEALTAR
jgi:hypothetical protein